MAVERVSSSTYSRNLLSQTHPERLADSARRALELVEHSTVGIEITAEYELADVETAIADLAGGATHGKSIVRIGWRQSGVFRGASARCPGSRSQGSR
jgi:NADPH2:quinone reductase